ncbi:shikimate O-hydroxycinnamoyltransferase-like [Panicum miliaceum]|uniref:Shikimate O-hydroxycinnamoyltransferase-like n=1 Tax=Panicum miliaceum TaxID=4540 RepID=A0A3L6Q3T9_PANMI|nr:shikimate O-hydroxycinnamoyltransferase-like [Panicum miliaceum]
MAAITVRRSTMVRPARETPRRRLWLSNLDLVAPRTHTPSVRFYRRRPDGAAGCFFDGERMRRALAEALVPFHPLAGRLGRAEDGRLELDCNGEGALFVEADAAGATVDDYGDFAPTPELRRLVPAVECADDVSAFPLLVLQVTYFKCGGVCLGVGTQHHVSDGLSASHFISSWSAVCRGARIASMPFVDRTLLRARDPPTPQFEHLEYHPAAPALVSSTPPSAATAVAIFKLTRADLGRLQSQLHGPAGGGEGGAARRLSTFAVVAAHVWRCACLARGLRPEQPTTLFTAPDLSVVLRRGASTFNDANLKLVSWAQMPVQDADFGWGRPVFMGPGGIAREGLGFVLPSAEGDGGMSVAISLQAEHMENFRKLIFEFELEGRIIQGSSKM